MLQVIDLLSHKRFWTTSRMLRDEMNELGQGAWNWRTIERDLHALTSIGIVEHQMRDNENNRAAYHFRLIGNTRVEKLISVIDHSRGNWKEGSQ